MPTPGPGPALNKTLSLLYNNEWHHKEMTTASNQRPSDAEMQEQIYIDLLRLPEYTSARKWRLMEHIYLALIYYY